MARRANPVAPPTFPLSLPREALLLVRLTEMTVGSKYLDKLSDFTPSVV